MSLGIITKWNFDRNKLVYNEELEDAMYAEEAKEFRDALLAYNDSPLNQLDLLVDMIDAYCDASFVYYGTVAKQIGATKLSDKNYELSIMNTYITEYLINHKVLLYPQEGMSTIEQALVYVIEANNKKPKAKTKTKIKKGGDWVDPKEQILSLLLERGYLEYPELTELSNKLKSKRADKEDTLVEGE